MGHVEDILLTTFLFIRYECVLISLAVFHTVLVAKAFPDTNRVIRVGNLFIYLSRVLNFVFHVLRTCRTFFRYNVDLVMHHTPASWAIISTSSLHTQSWPSESLQRIEPCTHFLMQNP